MSASTRDPAYARRLEIASGAWWKRWLDVQRPYRAHLRRLGLGFTLEVGCGIGRNLAHLGAGRAVGIDHNDRAVAVARVRGLDAYTPAEFAMSPHATPGRFDALLVSHVAEHLSAEELDALLRSYLPYVRAEGRVVVITPQEAGHRSDATHVRFMDFERVVAALARVDVAITAQYSFPLPRVAGRYFRYNEFVTLAVKR